MRAKGERLGKVEPGRPPCCRSRSGYGAELPVLEIDHELGSHGPLIAAASGPPIIQAVLWAGILLAS